MLQWSIRFPEFPFYFRENSIESSNTVIWIPVEQLSHSRDFVSLSPSQSIAIARTQWIAFARYCTEPERTCHFQSLLHSIQTGTKLKCNQLQAIRKHYTEWNHYVLQYAHERIKNTATANINDNLAVKTVLFLLP